MAADVSPLQRLRAMRLYACWKCSMAGVFGRVSKWWAADCRHRGAPRIDRCAARGDKGAAVPMNGSCGRRWRFYQRDVRLKSGKQKSTAASKWLFPSFGESGPPERQHFARDLKELAAGAGSRRGGEPHTCCVRLCQVKCLHNGANLRIVQTLRGHNDTRTKQIYTHVVEERFEELVRDLLRWRRNSLHRGAR